MAAPAHVQDDNANGVSVTSLGITLTGVSAGNLLYAITNGDTANRNWTMSDDNADTWTQEQEIDDIGADETQISYAKDVTGGNTLITATISTANGSLSMVVAEISGADTVTPVGASGQFLRASNGTTHFCAITTEIDTPSDVYIAAAGHLNANGDTLTKGASYTELFQFGSLDMFHYRTSAGALTDERGDWTSSTARNCQGVIVAFVAAATAALTGTAADTIDEADIVTGGKTVILTLTGDTWVTG